MLNKGVDNAADQNNIPEQKKHFSSPPLQLFYSKLYLLQP